MTEIEQKAVEELAQFIAEKLNKNQIFYVNQTYEDIGKQLADLLYSAHYRPEAEVRAQAVKEFAEKIDLYLIKLFHQAHDSQKECEQHNGTVWENGWQRKDERMIMIQNDILPFIRHLAEQYGKEE